MTIELFEPSIMIDKLKNTFQLAGTAIKEQAGRLGESAKEKSYQLIEDWVKIFPTLQQEQLRVNSMGLTVAISPALTVELIGQHEDFTREKITEILERHKSNTAIASVFNAIKSAYNLHSKIGAELREPLIVRIQVKITPEIDVFIGEPLIQ